MPSRNPFNCYSPWFYALVAVSVAVVIIGAFVGHSLPLRSAARIGVALVQGFSVASVIVSVFVSLRRLDELEQRIQYESLALAFAATAIVLTMYGFLERAGLPQVHWALWIYPLMFGFWGVSWAIVVRRYR
jgi:Kef-type K+ transport system membrane component KefB